MPLASAASMRLTSMVLPAQLAVLSHQYLSRDLQLSAASGQPPVWTLPVSALITPPTWANNLLCQAIQFLESTFVLHRFVQQTCPEVDQLALCSFGQATPMMDSKLTLLGCFCGGLLVCMLTPFSATPALVCLLAVTVQWPLLVPMSMMCHLT